MRTPLKILILEDSMTDAEIIQRFLIKERPDCIFSVAVDKKTFLHQLQEFLPHIILSDHSLPQFNSKDALTTAREKSPGIPFILVTGTVSEEFAADIIKQGADDFILKASLVRLPAAINNALNQRKAQKEKQEMIEKLVKSEEKYRTIFLKNPLPNWIYDCETLEFLDVNEAAIKHYGYSEKEFLSLSIKDIRPQEELGSLMNDLARIKHDPDLRQGNWKHRKKNGEIIIVETTAHFIDYNNRKARMVIVNDITEKLTAQEDLRKSEENYRTIMERVSDGFVAINKNWCYTYANKEAGEIMNRPAEELIGKHIWTEFPEGIGQPFYKAYHRAMEEQQYIHLEEYYAPFDLWLENHIYPSPGGLSIFFRNITGRKKAEEQRDFDRNNLSALINNTHDLMWSVDTDLKLITCNDAFNKVIEMMSGKPLVKGEDILSTQFTPEQVERYKIFYQRALSGETFTIIDHFEGPVQIWTEISFYPIRQEGAVIGTACFSRNITERKKVEEALRHSELRLNEAQATAHISNWDIDLVHNVHSWSDESFRIYGLNKTEAQPSTELFLSVMHPDDAAFAQAKMQEAFETLTNSSFDFRFIRGDGATRYGCTEWRFEFDEKKNPLRLFGIMQDITERKEAEDNLKLLEKKILEQKIQEQKKIARAIIKGQEKERNYIGKELHDNINQILAGTKIYLGIAAKKSAEVQEIIKYPMQLIDTSIEEIRVLCAKLVTPVKNINLEELVNDLTGKMSQGETIKAGFIYVVPDKLISDDLKLNIYRIIQELANNILKYAEAKKVNIVIETRDEAIRIVVEDDGKGFDLGSKRNGIGISNIINRAETFNGTVEIKTSPGNGCKTVVTIPF